LGKRQKEKKGDRMEGRGEEGRGEKRKEKR
jgi:hypothetical protein